MELARIDVEAVGLLLPLSTWRISFHGGLRTASFVSAPMSVPAMIASRSPSSCSSDFVRLARGEPGQLEQRRHEVDRAHLRLDDVGIEPGAESMSGTSTTSSKSVAPCMW